MHRLLNFCPDETERLSKKVGPFWIGLQSCIFCCTFVSVTCYVKFRMMCIMNFILNLCIAEKEIV